MNELQNMINSGGFGVNYPTNNIIPISQMNYNQPVNNGFTFAPVGGVNYSEQVYYQQQQNNNYYNPYANTFGSPYGNNVNTFGNPYSNYNNNTFGSPYGAYNNFMYNYGGGYSPYGGYGNIPTPSQYQNMLNQQNHMNKIKHRLAGAYFGKKYTEKELDDLVNPQRQTINLPPEQVKVINEYNEMKYYAQLLEQPPLQTTAMYVGNLIRMHQENMHKEFDNVSMVDFFDNHMWKINREIWLEENVDCKSKDLSKVYSSKNYNELLNLHRSSNPYINDILDTSRYDNNLDDMEIGVNISLAFDEQRRRKNILEGKVPDLVSSDDRQARRHAFTQQIIDQINMKNGGGGYV